MYFSDEIWTIIKDYLLHKKLEAIKTIVKHASLPYALSMHDCKGLKNNITFLKLKENWVFKLLYYKQIEKIIKDTESYLID